MDDAPQPGCVAQRSRGRAGESEGCFTVNLARGPDKVTFG